MAYIERENCKEYRNNISSTCEVNPKSSKCPCPTPSSDDMLNNERWSWLIDNWDNMSFSEKLALFHQKIHYIVLRDETIKTFDEVLSATISKYEYDDCRTLNNLKFDVDYHGGPHIIAIFDPIDISAVPDYKIRTKMIDWKEKYVTR